MQLTKEQIKIIASYWGAECRYEVPENLGEFGNENALTKWKTERRMLDGVVLLRLEWRRNFRLILRPLWSITEDELKELAKAIGIDEYKIETIVVDDTNDHWLEFDYKSLFQADNDGIFQVDANEDFFIHNSFIVPVINFLRAKGFCVDEEIKDFVEWKEVGK